MMKYITRLFIVIYSVFVSNVVAQTDLSYEEIEAYKVSIQECSSYDESKYTNKAHKPLIEALFLQKNGQYQKSNSILFDQKDLNQNEFNSLSVELHRSIGLNFYFMGKYDSSLSFFKDAISVEEKLDTFRHAPTLFVNIAAIYRIKNNMDSAIFFNNKARKIFESINDSLGLAKVSNNLGNLFKTSNSEKSVKYYNNALTIYQSFNDSLNVAKVLNNLALMYYTSRNFDLALVYYLDALDIFKKYNNVYYQVKILNNVGLIYIEKTEYKEAEKCLYESLDINIEQETSVMYTLSTVALLKYRTNKLREAKEYYIKSLRLAKKHNDLNLQKKIYNNLVYLSIDTKDISSAELYFPLYKEVVQKINVENYNDRLAEYEQTLEVEKTKNLLALSERDAKLKMEELARQEAEIKTKNSLLILGVVSILLLVSLVITITNISRKRKALAQAMSNQKKIIENHNAQLEQTVRERTKELEIAKIKAEESDLLKSAFLANLSHEIRTPLNSIMGFSDILCEEDRSQTEIKDYATIVRNNGFVLLNIISDLIDVSKIEASMFDIKMEIISHSDIIRIVEEENYDKPKFFDKIGVIDFVTCFNMEEFKVKTDLHKLAMVFEKLINNAFQFTEKGFVEIGSKKNDGYVQFYVSDSGMGIPQDRLEQIFENFRKFRNDEQIKYSGLGVGLYIAKHIIEQMGSELLVESVENQGSTFSFKLQIENV